MNLEILKKKENRPLVGVGIVALLTLVVGIVHGRVTNRWGMPADMGEGKARLAALKAKIVKEGGFGSWTLLKQGDLSKYATEVLEPQEFINATFQNLESKKVVDMFLVLGPTGPIAVHDPQVCYDARNYSDVAREPTKVGEQGDEFWALQMKPPSLENMLRVFYGWANYGPWTAPGDPRFSFGGQSKLFKIQVSTHVPIDTKFDAPGQDPCKDLLTELTPLMHTYLFSAEMPADAAKMLAEAQSRGDEPAPAKATESKAADMPKSAESAPAAPASGT